MYSIANNNDHLMVTVRSDLDYSMIKQIIYDELVMPEFRLLHDIWHVGKHRAQIRLGEIQTIVDDFRNLCPPDTCDKKVAIVAEPGLTASILKLLADGLDKKLPLSCRMFGSVDAAKEWIGAEAGQVA